MGEADEAGDVVEIPAPRSAVAQPTLVRVDLVASTAVGGAVDGIPVVLMQQVECRPCRRKHPRGAPCPTCGRRLLEG